MDADDLPFRCERCGSFVGQERGYEADDFRPSACKRCKRARDITEVKGD